MSALWVHISAFTWVTKIQPHIHQMPLCVVFSVTFNHEIVTSNIVLSFYLYNGNLIGMQLKTFLIQYFDICVFSACFQ